MRNPKWTTDELILALELYFRDDTARGNKVHPEVIRLSEILNSLPIHPGGSQDQNFRNPNGVAMKLSNFMRFDPLHDGKGLERGAKAEEEVWDTYHNDHAALKRATEAILDNISYFKTSTSTDDLDEVVEAPEGKLLTRVHRTRERNKSIVKRKKETVQKKTGALKCEACDFDFKEVYGELGDGFAECHHKKPVSQLKPGETTKLEDLAILCANYHRMVHRSKPWLSVENLRSILNR